MLFLLTIFYGCNDNPVGNSLPLPNSIKSITSSGEDFVKYYYDGNLLLKKEMFGRGELVTTIVFSYDKGRLIRRDESSKASGILLVTYSTFEYSTDDKLTKANAYRKAKDSFLYSGYYQYEYNNNKLIKYSFYNTDNELRNYHILTYKDDNITEELQYDADGNLLYQEEFEYDNKINPLTKDISYFSAFTLSRNNVVKWTNSYLTVSPPNVYITTSSFNYNELGYPTRCTTIYKEKNTGETYQSTNISEYEYY